MTAGSISLRINRCRRACGYFRGWFKALVLLGMCGGIYYLSQLPQVEYLSDEDPLTEENFVLVMTSSSPQIKSVPEVVPVKFYHDVISSPIQDEGILEEFQLVEENLCLVVASSSSKVESIPEEVNVTSSCQKFESIPEEVLLTKTSFDVNEASNPSNVEPIPEEVNMTSKSLEVESIPEVVQLTKDNFHQLVTSSSEPWLVEFYAPSCPHCIKFANDYVKVAERLWGLVNVGKVNGAEEKSIKSQFGVKRFPSFLIFHGNKTSPILYRGPRTEDSIVKKVLELVL